MLCIHIYSIYNISHAYYTYYTYYTYVYIHICAVQWQTGWQHQSEWPRYWDFCLWWCHEAHCVHGNTGHDGKGHQSCTRASHGNDCGRAKVVLFDKAGKGCNEKNVKDKLKNFTATDTLSGSKWCSWIFEVATLKPFGSLFNPLQRSLLQRIIFESNRARASHQATWSLSSAGPRGPHSYSVQWSWIVQC